MRGLHHPPVSHLLHLLTWRVKGGLEWECSCLYSNANYVPQKLFAQLHLHIASGTLPLVSSDW